MVAPKIIWMYWHSGLAEAPILVRICIESWKRRNPGWTVRVLNEDSLADWVDMQDVRNRNPRITIQAFADVLRWRLLKKYGGVWADATLYCNKPLDDWLPAELQNSAIFMFRTDNVELIYSWFIAAHDTSVLVSSMDKQMSDFICRFGGFRHYFDLRGIWRIYHLIEKSAGRKNYVIWRSWIWRRFLKAAPYFFQNYLMGYIISSDNDCKDEFNRIIMSYGESPHYLQEITKSGQSPTVEAVRDFLEAGCPVQKLTLKRYVVEWTEGGILDLLDQYGRKSRRIR